MNTLCKGLRFAFEWLLTPLTMLPSLLRTYAQLFDIFSGTWERRTEKTLWCFSDKDSAFRGWYEKLARDFTLRGRFGYAWDNGAGDNLGSKIYNNFVTYWLYGKLGTKRFTGLAIGIFASVLFCSVWMQFGLFIALLTLFFFLPSPVVVVFMMRMGKPECLFWSASFAAMLLLFSGWYISAGLLWSCLAFCNLPAAAMCVIFAGPVGCVLAFSDGMLLQFFLALAPGAVKTAGRVWYMFRAGTLSQMCVEQIKMASIPLMPFRWEFLMAIPVTLSLCMIPSLSSGGTSGWAPCCWILFASWLNDRFIRYNDKESVQAFIIICALALAITSGNIVSYTILLYLLYPPIQDVQAGFPSAGPEWEHAAKRRTYYQLYPNLSPRPYLVPDDLQSFFSHIPKFSRIIAEYDGDPRSDSPMRVFWSYLDMYRACRSINLFNDMYLRPFAPRISAIFANRFSSSLMSAQEMAEHLRHFGVSHVIAYTDAMCLQMEAMGFTRQAEVSPNYGGLLHGQPSAVLERMHPTLHIYRTTVQDGVVSGTDTFRVSDDTFSFIADAGKAYTIRLLYSAQFHIRQGETELSFLPATHDRFAYEPLIFLPNVGFGTVTLTHPGPLCEHR